MPRKSPFKHPRFPREIILCAVRWYLRYPLTHQDVVELLEERGVIVDRSTVYRSVQNCRYDPHFDSIRHIDKKWRNNLIESDHAAMKRILGYRQSFRSLRSAKATLRGLDTMNSVP